MPGHKHVMPRARVMPEDPQAAEPTGIQAAEPTGIQAAEPTGIAASVPGSGPEESGPRSRSLAVMTNRPTVAGLIALLAALAFALARWQTWAGGSISRFILVGRHFATPAQLPPGMPVAPTYGYDGQFF